MVPGVVEPRHIAVSTRSLLRHAVLRLGHAISVDRHRRTLELLNRDGSRSEIGWDRLVLAPVAVTRTFDIPGLAEHALGLKTLSEATDEATIQKYFAMAHERLVDNPPWLFIVHDLNPRAFSRKVKGFVSPQSWFVDLTLVDLQ